MLCPQEPGKETYIEKMGKQRKEVHWKRKWQTTQYSCSKNLRNSIKRQKDMTAEDELPSVEGVQYHTGKEQRVITNSPRKKESGGPKQKQHSVVNVSGGESKIRRCKEQHQVGTWNVRSMNQGKLDVVKQEMARMNIDIRNHELKRTGIGKFNSNDHCIYYVGKNPPG